jgi:methylmalonyl-CoA mutase
MADKELLFNEFQPVTASEWKAKIENDLKGKPFEKLISHPDEGFEIQPFYMREHLPGSEFLQSEPGSFPFLRGKQKNGNTWQVNQDFTINHAEQTRKEALQAIENGADSLNFVFPESTAVSLPVLEQLLHGMEKTVTTLHFRGELPANFPAVLSSLSKKHPGFSDWLQGSVENDPIRNLNLRGRFREKEPFEKLDETFRATAHFPHLRSVTVDGTVFHNAGGTTVSEMAFTLAAGSEYLHQLTDRGADAGIVASKILFRLATGSDYFMEIAKFRAFRYLWAHILKAYGLTDENAAAFVMAENSYRNKTVYDPYVNMLRTTTETMSAILGGADAVTVLPFDAAFETPGETAKRIARNQQLILREESYFDKTADPAAGSYYIENLTANLIEKSWELFLETDEQGGYVEAFKQGFVQQRIEKEAAKKDADIASGKVAVLGVNRFPNIRERQETHLDRSVFETAPARKSSGPRPLRIYRAAALFEKLRYATDLFARTRHRPKVWLFTLGDLAMRRARAQFAENFFGCAGYEIIDHAGFASAEEGIKAAKNDKPDIVVLCSDDHTYETEALTVFEALKHDTIVVLAGYPEPLVPKLKAAGMTHFIHRKSNLLEELRKFNKILRIE